MADKDLHLELGDIIQIIAPTDTTINNKQFYIDYIDEQEVNLVENNGTVHVLYITPERTFRNESITGIEILDRASELGYARQHQLLPGTWINIHLGGDFPTIIIGKITNIEEDQIEIKPIDTEGESDQAPIYIDFAYKGVPKDIPIESMEIRKAPPGATPSEAEEAEETPTDRVAVGDEEKIDMTVPEIKKQIRDLIFEADQIEFGEDLEVITQVVDVPEEKKKYSITQQTTDLLDDLLSDVPNRQRTSMIINNIHTMIERYKQLRAEFSIFDQHENILTPKKHGPDYKPLAEVLSTLSHKLYWTLPVAKNKKKLYNVESYQLDEETDVVHVDLANVRTEETEIIDSYFENTISGDNKYYALVKKLQPFYTPFDPPYSTDHLLSTQKVQTNITSVVDNLNNFDSSVAKNNEIKQKRFFIQDYTLGEHTLKYTKNQGWRYAYYSTQIN